MGTTVPGDPHRILPPPRRPGCAVERLWRLRPALGSAAAARAAPSAELNCRGFISALQAHNPLAGVQAGVVLGTGEIVHGRDAGRGMERASRSAATADAAERHTVTRRRVRSQTDRRSQSVTVTQERRHADGSADVRSVQRSDEQSHTDSWEDSVVLELVRRTVEEQVSDRGVLDIAREVVAADRERVLVQDITAPVSFGEYVAAHAEPWFARLAAAVRWPALDAERDMHALFDNLVDSWPTFCELWRSHSLERRQQLDRDVAAASRAAALHRHVRWTRRMLDDFVLHPLGDRFLTRYLYPTDGATGDYLDCAVYFAQLHAWCPVGRYAKPTCRFTGSRPNYWFLDVEVGRRHRQRVIVSTPAVLITPSRPAWLAVRAVAATVVAPELEHVVSAARVCVGETLGRHICKRQLHAMVDELLQ